MFLSDIFSMKTKNLIICGKANRDKSVAEIKPKNSELWLLGTDPREGADRYFELHGITVNHENVTTELPKEVYELGLPVNNSICALLVFAFIQGYKNITVLGAPMDAAPEYIEARPALAYVVGWLNATGVNVEWDVIPATLNYGKKKEKDEEES